MKRNYKIRLINKDFCLDDENLFFRSSLYQARRVFDALSFVLPCSPYQAVSLEYTDGTQILFSNVRCK